MRNITTVTTISQVSKAFTLVGLVTLAACGDIGLSAGPSGTTDSGSTTATTGSTTSGTTTSGTTTSGTTTSGTTTSGTTTSGTTGSTTSGTTTASACTSTTETYANFGQAFFTAHCVACHNGAGPDLSTLAAVQANQSDCVSQITAGTMPQGATLSASDKANVLAWLNCNPLP